MTAAAVPLDAAAARVLTDRIKVAVEATWELVAEAYRSRAWAALGYASWDDYTTREFGTSRLRLPREDRTEVVASLRESGLSIRAISAATGLSDQTVQRDLRPVVNHYTSESEVLEPAELESASEPDGVEFDEFDMSDPTTAAAAEWLNTMPADEFDSLFTTTPAVEPEPLRVVGVDGKTYPAHQNPTRPRQRPITDQANTLGFDMRRNADRLAALVGDKRYPQNEEQVALILRGHLLHVAETVAAVLDQLPNS